MIRDRYLPVLASTGTKEERMTRAAVAVRNLRLSNPGICGAWHFLDRTTCMLLVTSATCMFLPLLCFSSLARWFFERRFSNPKDVHRMVYYIVWRGLQNHVVAGYNICFYDISRVGGKIFRLRMVSSKQYCSGFMGEQSVCVLRHLALKYLRR